jgi:pimeloyl-ACP methyl ester carboxylesterase
MMPLYFGPGDQQLFGVYEPARQGDRASRAAVLCNPVGNEYIHAHRTMRNLASRLSKAGYHVLRFDYYGTGDSAGDSDKGNPDRWCDDIGVAMSELRDMTGATKITLIGLRLGANLAARVSVRDPLQIESLVLWEPLPVSYDTVTHFVNGDAATVAAMPADISIAALPWRTLVLLTEQDPRSAGFGELEVGHVPSPSPWVERFFEPEVIPVQALAFIVKWLSG